MFKQIIIEEGIPIFLMNDGKYITGNTKYDEFIKIKFEKFPRKVNVLFGHIFNKPYVVQDLIDYNMDQDIGWDFIVLAIKVSRTIRKK